MRNFIKKLLSKNTRQKTYTIDDLINAIEQKMSVGQIGDIIVNVEDINQVNEYGGTALYYASRRGSVEIVRMLLKRGADVNLVPTFRYFGGTALYWASREGREEIVRLLLEAGADVNLAVTTDGNLAGSTPLYMASREGKVEIVKMLLDKNGDLNKSLTGGYYVGETAIKAARRNGHNAVVNLINVHLITAKLDLDLMCVFSHQDLSVNGTFAGECAYSTGGQHLYQESQIRQYLEANNGAATDPMTRASFKAENLLNMTDIIKNHFAARIEKVSENLGQLSDEARSSLGREDNNSRDISSYTIEGFKAFEAEVGALIKALPSAEVKECAVQSEVCSSSSIAFTLRVQKTNSSDPVSVSGIGDFDYHDGIEEEKACSSSSAAALANDGVAEAKEYDFQSVASSSSSDTTKASKSQTAKLEQVRRAAKPDDSLSK